MKECLMHKDEPVKKTVCAGQWVTVPTNQNKPFIKVPAIVEWKDGPTVDGVVTKKAITRDELVNVNHIKHIKRGKEHFSNVMVTWIIISTSAENQVAIETTLGIDAFTNYIDTSFPNNVLQE
jgi:hypothetical protein